MALNMLQRRLQQQAQFLSLAVQKLPQCPQLQLNLVDQQSIEQGFSNEQIQAILAYPAYWSFCWGSGQALAAQLLAAGDLSGLRVVDFGCGSGVVGIAAAMAGAQVIACDLDEDARMACQLNAQLNGVGVDLVDDFFAIEGRVDLILAADVLYDAENWPLLNSFCERADTVLLADSRVDNFKHDKYRWVSRRQASTYPEMEEQPRFSQIDLYVAGNVENLPFSTAIDQ